MAITVEQWKIKKLLKDLAAAGGHGTSMISLIVPPGDQVARVSKMLADEAGTAANIKSRVNRLSVLGAITSATQRLKLYSKIPPNGLVLYCGTVDDDDGKSKKLTVDFEPFAPINTSLYMCDNRFHTEPLRALLEMDRRTIGFLVVDGNGALFGTLSGGARTVLHRFTVNLQGKKRRGGQSALRYSRLREAERHQYLRKVCEHAAIHFFADGAPAITELIVAGAAAFKDDVAKSPFFDARLKKLVVETVDVSYGGEPGFNEAIELAASAIADNGYVRERALLSRFMREIARDTGKYCFGAADTLAALDLGAVETLIVWEGLDIARDDAKDGSPGEPLLDWLVETHESRGAELRLVSASSPEGSQFCKGFGGVGGLLRWVVDFEDYVDEVEDSD